MAKNKKPEVDVRITNNGSTFSFTLLTEAARAWVAENVQLEGWQWMGRDTFVVDHRYAEPIAAMMQDQEEGPGLVIE